MRPTTHKLIAAISAITLAGGLITACSPDEGSNAQSGAASGGNGEIVYMHRLPDGANATPVAQIVERWNKDHPDAKVKAVKWDGEAQEMVKKIETDVNAGVGPCLAQVGYGEAPTLFAKGLLMDVTDSAKQYEDNYASGAYSLMNVGGVQTGLPQDTGPMVYYYNKAEFEKLGLEIPKTAEEFVATAKKAAEKGKFIADFQTDEAASILSGMAAAAGSQWYQVQDDKWKINTEDEGSKVVGDFWQKLLDDKSALTEARWDDAFKAALSDQRLIGTFGAAWEAPLLAQDMAGTANDGQWAVAQMPDFGKGQVTGPNGGSGVSVIKGCQNPDKAMEFNNWFNTQVEDLLSQGLVVAAKGEVETPQYLKDFYSGQDIFQELTVANKNAASFSYVPGWGTVVSAINKAAAAPADGSGKVADVFKTAQNTSVSAVKDLNLPVAE